MSTYADLSYQRYEQSKSSYVNGYVWSTGLLYLPGGDGLEMVRAEYYGIDSGGGSVNGGKLAYENRVYENILFRANCNVGYYDKSTNQSGTAVASLIGIGYMFLPGLVGEVNFEANRNQFFPEDFRFGFFVTLQRRLQHARRRPSRHGRQPGAALAVGAGAVRSGVLGRDAGDLERQSVAARQRLGRVDVRRRRGGARSGARHDAGATRPAAAATRRPAGRRRRRAVTGPSRAGDRPAA